MSQKIEIMSNRMSGDERAGRGVMYRSLAVLTFEHAGGVRGTGLDPDGLGLELARSRGLLPAGIRFSHLPTRRARVG
jgi:hypothetical protein